MRQFKQYLWLLGCIVAAACTQQPAPIEDRGAQFYGREFDAVDSPRHETFSKDSPKYKDGYTQPVEPATVPSVSVANLAPPGTYANQPPAQPAAVTPPVIADSAPAAVVSHPAVASAPAVVTPPSAKPVASGENRFVWPVTGGKVISHFGAKPDGKINDGINIALAEGEPIWAAADGMVVYAGNQLEGYGNMVILRHDNGWMSAYAHARTISVKKNDYVKQGELIGYVGMTGGLKAPQVHFVLRHGKTPVDPEQYLPKTTAAE